MKNLENYGVKELNTKDIKETDGGIFGAILAAAAIYLVYETIGNWSASREAFESGYAAGNSYR